MLVYGRCLVSSLRLAKPVHAWSSPVSGVWMRLLRPPGRVRGGKLWGTCYLACSPFDERRRRAGGEEGARPASLSSPGGVELLVSR